MPMKSRFTAPRRATLAAALFGLCTLGFAASAYAVSVSVTATDAWVRWLPNNLPSAGYVTINNASGKNIDLIDVSSPDYGSAMLHRTVSNGSTTNMVMVDKATVPAHGTLKIAPVGYHIMLEEATHAIKPGDTVHLKLKFSDGETLDTPFAVKSPGTAK